MWVWLAENTIPVPKGNVIVGILLVLLIGAVIGWVIAAAQSD